MSARIHSPFMTAVGFGSVIAAFAAVYSLLGLFTGDLSLFEAMILPSVAWVCGGLLMFVAERYDIRRHRKR